MLISIIIPTYNRVQLLIETIDSILSQTYSNFELIIVSDGSNDNTKQKVTQIKDTRIKFIELEKNYGYPAKARNEGIKISKGDFIAFCDDDDLWEKNKLEKQVKFIDKGYDFIFTNIKFIDSEKSFIKKLYSTFFIYFIINILNKSFSYFFLSFTNPIANSSVLLSKKVLSNLYFEESILFRAVEDYQLWIKIFLKTKPYYINDNLINYRIHESNISSDFINNLKKCLMIMDSIKAKSFSQRLFKMIGIMFYSIRIFKNKLF
jgi:teichuronic acid biosynthesis glycosyltransferase TuaG